MKSAIAIKTINKNIPKISFFSIFMGKIYIVLKAESNRAQILISGTFYFEIRIKSIVGGAL